MAKRNVILITIDSLRRDFLGCYGYPNNISPTIDRLARKGVLFMNAWANGPNTPHAFKSIMMGKYPLQEPGYGVFEKNDYLPCIFKKDDYKTIGIVADNVLISRYYGYDKGFDVFIDFMDKRQSATPTVNVLTKLRQIAKLIPYKVGTRFYVFFMAKLYDLLKKKYESPMLKCLYPEVLNELESVLHNSNGIIKQNKVFLWLHFMDVHHPYSKPRDMSHGVCRSLHHLINFHDRARRMPKKRISAEVIMNISKMYEQSIRDIDGAIEELFVIFEKYGLLKDSSIFILSDHGDLLGEHGLLGHRRSLFSELLKIPAIVYEDSVTGGGNVCKKTVSQRDIYELILMSRENSVSRIIREQSISDENEIFAEMYNDDFGRMYMDQKKYEVNLFELDVTGRKVYSVIKDDKKLTYHQSEGKNTFSNLCDNVLEVLPSDADSYHDMIEILNQHMKEAQETRRISKRRYELHMVIRRIVRNLLVKLQNRDIMSNC